LIQGRLVIVKELIDLIRPAGRIIPIKARKIQAEGASLNAPILGRKLEVFFVLDEATSIPVILIIPLFRVMEATIVQTAQGRNVGRWTSSRQGAEHVSDICELSLDRSVVSVLAGNGVLTFFDGVGKLVETGVVGHEERGSRRKNGEGSDTKCRVRKDF
jgi:hypothetical protein